MILCERVGLWGDDVKFLYIIYSGVYLVCIVVEVLYRYNLNVYYVLYLNKDYFIDKILYIDVVNNFLFVYEKKLL